MTSYFKQAYIQHRYQYPEM